MLEAFKVCKYMKEGHWEYRNAKYEHDINCIVTTHLCVRINFKHFIDQYFDDNNNTTTEGGKKGGDGYTQTFEKVKQCFS